MRTRYLKNLDKVYLRCLIPRRLRRLAPYLLRAVQPQAAQPAVNKARAAVGGGESGT